MRLSASMPGQRFPKSGKGPWDRGRSPGPEGTAHWLSDASFLEWHCRHFGTGVRRSRRRTRATPARYHCGRAVQIDPAGRVPRVYPSPDSPGPVSHPPASGRAKICRPIASRLLRFPNQAAQTLARLQGVLVVAPPMMSARLGPPRSLGIACRVDAGPGATCRPRRGIPCARDPTCRQWPAPPNPFLARCAVIIVMRSIRMRWGIVSVPPTCRSKSCLTCRTNCAIGVVPFSPVNNRAGLE